MLISSHILSEIQALCDQIVIISKGQVVADGTPSDLEALISGTQTTRLLIRAESEQARDDLTLLPRLEVLSQIPHVEQVDVQPAESEGNTLVLTLTAAAGEDIRAQVFSACASAKLPVLEMSTSRKTLEDVFVELVGDAERTSESSTGDASGTGGLGDTGGIRRPAEPPAVDAAAEGGEE